MRENQPLSLTKSAKAKLEQESIRIQPDSPDMEKVVKDTSDITKNVYNQMLEIYKYLCDQDISFSLFFNSPDPKDDFCAYNFYRICELDDQKRFQGSASRSCWLQYQALCDMGYIQNLEKEGYLKILPKGQHQSFAQQNDIIL